MAMTYAARSCRVSINLTYRFDSFGSFEMERARFSRLDDDFDENYDRLPARDDQSNPGFSCTFHAEELKRGKADRNFVEYLSTPLRKIQSSTPGPLQGDFNVYYKLLNLK